MTYEELRKAQEGVKTTDIKGKDYVQVNSRVNIFRRLFPEGTITTDILSNENGTVLMKATVSDEKGKVLSTGLAYEKETSSYINKTSYIENAETSAVGRALGFLGIGIDASIASVEEMVNAINNQDGGDNKTQPKQQSREEIEAEAKKKRNDMIERINVLCKETGKNMTKPFTDMPDKELEAVIKALEKLPKAESKAE